MTMTATNNRRESRWSLYLHRPNPRPSIIARIPKRTMPPPDIRLHLASTTFSPSLYASRSPTPPYIAYLILHTLPPPRRRSETDIYIRRRESPRIPPALRAICSHYCCSCSCSCRYRCCCINITVTILFQACTHTGAVCPRIRVVVLE
ncbi:uncharacterized protein CC84DRAFT_731308 [Paraphaeosphaeria sporulosa]|uniref:Uncharacterized protein n=1 Tax=Paraphaeosphaeria sporulosa TaxID=1460663 RepID=A0A177CFT5_9PLEO|nr:uncharacterized protein CC84DRAFT_731308 [Paraphaeosphaeria sporulosa]OAG05689.1 hypothetical protein CC84DRAFT_731308 [Paraphaeosphaeria sporulosa]